MKKFMLFAIMSGALLAGCNTDKDMPYNATDFAQGGPDAPLYNERSSEFMQSDNQYANIDSYKPKTAEEKEQNSNRWTTARMETRWQEYKGAMVRVQIVLGNTDGDARTILAKVADYEMKRVCGRNADSIVMVYDRPSFDAMRPTPFFDYRIEAEGATMREYGFRCVYAVSGGNK